MSALASQITSLTSVYSTVYSRRWSKKISKPRVTSLCDGNSPVTCEFPTQMASSAENVSIWWRHHGRKVMWFLVQDAHRLYRWVTKIPGLFHTPIIMLCLFCILYLTQTMHPATRLNIYQMSYYIFYDCVIGCADDMFIIIKHPFITQRATVAFCILF